MICKRRPSVTWIPNQVVPKIVKNMTYVLWVNLSLAILISIFGFYKTFKKWFEDKEKDDPEFPRNSGLAYLVTSRASHVAGARKLTLSLK